jgi:hypothetical protein
LTDVIPPNDIGVTFDDIGALENVKDTLKELVMLPLQRPELFCKGQLTKVLHYNGFTLAIIFVSTQPNKSIHPPKPTHPDGACAPKPAHPSLAPMGLPWGEPMR